MLVGICLFLELYWVGIFGSLGLAGMIGVYGFFTVTATIPILGLVWKRHNRPGYELDDRVSEERRQTAFEYLLGRWKDEAEN